MKLVVTLLFGAALVSGCGAERVSPKMAKGDDQCLWESTACTRSSECCSMWCVNGYCERREP